MISLRDRQDKLDAAKVAVFGISYDSKESHIAFREKYKLTTPLLVDNDKKLGKAFGLSTGSSPNRRTIVIDKDGKIKAVITNVNLSDHASQILDALKTPSVAKPE